MHFDKKLERFILPQKSFYSIALDEIKSGIKTGHWMWFIFPQIRGLGNSDKAQYYAISCLEEAIAYLNHPILGARLIEITSQLLMLKADEFDPNDYSDWSKRKKSKNSRGFCLDDPYKITWDNGVLKNPRLVLSRSTCRHETQRV